MEPNKTRAKVAKVYLNLFPMRISALAIQWIRKSFTPSIIIMSISCFYFIRIRCCMQTFGKLQKQS
jgi:hypothetical protein